MGFFVVVAVVLSALKAAVGAQLMVHLCWSGIVLC